MADNSTSRKSYLDFLRVIAILLVIVNHTAIFSIPLSGNACMENYLFLHCSILVKVAVPLFLMVSGALLLPKVESLETVLKKRVFRYVLVIIAFQFMQRGYSFLCSDAEWSYRAISESKNGALVTWFLYAYMAVMLLLPLLRVMARNMSDKLFLYLFALHLVFSAFSPFSSGPQRWLVLSNFYEGQYVFIYLFAGYFVEHRLSVACITRHRLMCLCAMSVASVMLGALMCEIGRRMGHYSCYYFELPCFQGCVFIPCITIYLLVKKIFCKCLQKTCITHIVCSMGGAVFTIMLTENMWRDAVGTVMSHVSQSPVIVALLSLPFVYIFGFLSGMLMKRIPVVNRYL